MAKFLVLDCTLRDGGYINDWAFGQDEITKIVSNIDNAGIDIIEGGFLTNSKVINKDKSLFRNVCEANEKFRNIENSCIALMINCGEYDIREINEYSHGNVNIIRLAFHKEQIEKAKEDFMLLKHKGYKVFFQPMVTMRYTDMELIELLMWCNQNSVDAVYIVDSFGTMRKKDVLRIFFLFENNLDEKIKIGFHSHNNLQLSFSNAQELVALNNGREIIIDTSVLGMGRGAGNLCTELMIQYLNDNLMGKYNILPILEVMDEYIMPIFRDKPWGYSVPYYIAAVHECHPNYATYLSNMQTLFVKDINRIIGAIKEEKKNTFDKSYIKSLYSEYQRHNYDDATTILELKKICIDKEVLLIAPGRTIAYHEGKIKDYIKEKKPIVFSLNHITNICSCHKIFVNNIKRYKEIVNRCDYDKNNIICTSNIETINNESLLNYSTYLENEMDISDNAGIMLMNVMKVVGVRKISLAGFDGYNEKLSENYFDNSMVKTIEIEKIKDINRSFRTYLKNNEKNIDVKFLTPSLYENYKQKI